MLITLKTLRAATTLRRTDANSQGRYSPSLEIAFQIARVFKVPLDEVFHYPDDDYPDGDEELS